MADLPGAVGHVAAPPGWVLPVLALGGLWLCLWQGRGRLAGGVTLALAALFWSTADRPQALISADGALVGVTVPEGRALSREKGAGFVAGTWLENDGSGHNQPQAAAFWLASDAPSIARLAFAGGEIIHLQGKTGSRTWQGCEAGQIIVSNVDLDLQGGCLWYDPERLSRTGAIALYATEKGPRLRTDLDLSGHRLWHPEFSAMVGQ